MTEYEKTPRTDKAAFTSTFGGPVVVDVDFAQELEIELAEAKAELRKLREKREKQKMTETPRTDEYLRKRKENGHTVIVSSEFARELERENRNLRTLLDKASQAIDAFVDLRGMTAMELKSAHNGICVFLSATKMLDAIKAEIEEGEK